MYPKCIYLFLSNTSNAFKNLLDMTNVFSNARQSWEAVDYTVSPNLKEYDPSCRRGFITQNLPY